MLRAQRSTVGTMPAVGELVHCIDGSWMTPPQSCPRGHRFRSGAIADSSGRGTCGVLEPPSGFTLGGK